MLHKSIISLMLKKETYRYLLFPVFLLFVLLVYGCSAVKSAPTLTPAPTLIPATPLPPTPTTPPLAEKVNGQGIWLQDYQAELGRLQKAQIEVGKTLTPAEASKMVLDSMTADSLLAQAAVKDGYKPDEAQLQKKVEDQAQQIGGVDKLAAWEQANNYTDDSLKRSLALALAAGWERSKIIDAVPQATEQVHARQIMVKDQDLANTIYQKLQNGSKFDDLALKYEPLTGGDLGWFPRGALFQPDVETAVFNLQPTQYSPVIKTSYGFQIVECIERDPQHPLAPDIRLTLQHKALDAWMKDALASAKIEVLLK